MSETLLLGLWKLSVCLNVAKVSKYPKAMFQKCACVSPMLLRSSHYQGGRSGAYSMSLGKAYAKVICWWSLEEVEKEVFFQFNIPIIPLSKWLRIKLIQFLRLVDFALTLAWIAYGKLRLK